MTQPNGNSVSSASDPYRLNRNVAASTRLSLQHYIWKENMGYLLHPSIDVSRPDLAIADVGTGTGIWILDLLRQLPNAKLHGFDISSEQYPAPGFLPPNVSLSKLDILGEIPEEYRGKFDVVHARLLVQVVNQAGSDPVPVIQNMMKLLKPGGYLQWEEPNDDASKRPIVKADPANSSENAEKLLQRLDARFRAATPASWSVALAETFKEQGLQNVVREEFSTDTYLLLLDQTNYLGLFGELISKLDGDLKEELTKLHANTVVEARNGLSWKVRRFAFVGQKP
ncbi:class I SAM-dependent methyltransferase [Aspergillus novofumigatus IBT 16806]|uniref:S-adenosyl-L-methionine-dependent methyltransferase n=1 Tax=Aspergillus novofumigatus (strain IBT 16806) TaxID=1392255 RepID=A0A2I1BTL4_ASPN1|nr:S-adenosyl-L-methionine-dependent methyltransferase [Aspergillus novofumigatus IBT 16806]PKX88641.1 S-adenosyl-L-methionine-dependent methyltransferase [Aspergillus novofumigatus IBT 16806]